MQQKNVSSHKYVQGFWPLRVCVENNKDFAEAWLSASK